MNGVHCLKKDHSHFRYFEKLVLTQPKEESERLKGNGFMQPPAAEIEVRCGSVVCLWRYGRTPAVVRAIEYRRGSKSLWYFRVGPYGGDEHLDFEHLPQNASKGKLFIDKSSVVEAKQLYFVSAIICNMYSDPNVELDKLQRVERLLNAARDEAAAAAPMAAADEMPAPPPPVEHPVIVVREQMAAASVPPAVVRPRSVPDEQAIVVSVPRNGGILQQYDSEEIFSPGAAGRSRRVGTMTQIVRKPAGLDLSAIGAGFQAMSAALANNTENQRQLAENQRQLQIALIEALASNRSTAEAAIAAAAASSVDRKLFLDTMTSQHERYESQMREQRKAHDDEKRELKELLKEERERSDARHEKLTNAFITKYTGQSTSPDRRQSQ